MACDNNKNTPFGQFMDMKVTYTGCGGTCNGSEIKYGMNLREVLDILVGDCQNSDDQRGVAVFASTTAPIDNLAEDDLFINMEDGSISQYIEGSWTDTGYSIAGGESVWGSIGGNIEDQADLVAYVTANAGISADDIGTNLHLDDDGKLNVGVDISDLIPDTETVLIAEGGVFPAPSGKGYIILSSVLGNSINTQGGNLEITTESGELDVRSSTRSSLHGGTSSVNAYPGGVEVTTDNGTLNISPTLASFGSSAGAVSIHGTHPSFPDRRVARLFAAAGQWQVGIFSAAPANGGTSTTREIIVGAWDSTNSHFNAEIMFRYGSASIAITQDDQIVHKKYVDDLISGLQNQITALEARVAALEGA